VRANSLLTNREFVRPDGEFIRPNRDAAYFDVGSSNLFGRASFVGCDSEAYRTGFIILSLCGGIRFAIPPYALNEGSDPSTEAVPRPFESAIEGSPAALAARSARPNLTHSGLPGQKR